MKIRCSILVVGWVAFVSFAMWLLLVTVII